jgi:hypothetical protein
MYCPNCGSQNADSNKFCHKCGNQLAQPSPPGHEQIPIPGLWGVHPPDPTSNAATIGGISSLAGGGFVVLGWFVPWFSLGGLARWILSLLDIGTGLGSFGFGAGVGNGLQISLLSLTAGLAALSSDEGVVVLFGLLCWVFAGIIISIPLVAVMIIRVGLKSFEASPFQTQNDPQLKAARIRENMENVRGKSVYLFGLLATIFVMFAAIPFGTAVLGSGFYLAIFGALISFLGALFARSQVSNVQWTGTMSG